MWLMWAPRLHSSKEYDNIYGDVLVEWLINVSRTPTCEHRTPGATKQDWPPTEIIHELPVHNTAVLSGSHSNLRRCCCTNILFIILHLSVLSYLRWVWDDLRPSAAHQCLHRYTVTDYSCWTLLTANSASSGLQCTNVDLQSIILRAAHAVGQIRHEWKRATHQATRNQLQPSIAYNAD